jgi:hypothetical protein
LKNIHLLRCAAPFVITAYLKIRLTPQDLHALHLAFFEQLNKSLNFFLSHPTKLVLGLFKNAQVQGAQ